MIVNVKFEIKNAKCGIIALLTAYCLLPTATHAGILESYTYGEPNYILSARSLGMGGTFIAGDITMNPASFAYLEGPVEVVGFKSYLQGERRSKKAFDSFDNTIGDVTISDNSFVYLTPNPFVFGYPFKFFNLALQINPKYEFDYRYERIVRDEYYVKIKDIYEECDGNLWAYSVVLAKKSGKFGFGLRYDYINGRIRYEKDEEFVDTTLDSYQYCYKTDWSGWDLSLGVNMDINWRFRIAAFYDRGGKIEGKGLYKGIKIDYPPTLGFGVRYRPSNELPVTLNIDIIHTRWEELQSATPPNPFCDTEIIHIVVVPTVSRFASSNNSLLYNTTSYRLGVEHLFSPTTKMRFGFAYIPSYLDKSIARAEFTFGGGFVLSGFDVDIGTSIGRRVYNGDKVPGDVDPELTFEEMDVKILTTLTRRF